MISAVCDSIIGGTIRTIIDLSNVNDLIQMKEENNFTPLNHSHYSQFKYQIILFGFMYSPATFQTCINDCIQPYMEHSTVYAVKDVTNNSTNA